MASVITEKVIPSNFCLYDNTNNQSKVFAVVLNL